MGQRTATLVSYIDEQGKKHNKVYYHQWGIGRVQTNAIMGNFLCQIGEPKFDLSGTRSMCEVEVDGIENADFNDIKQVQNIIMQMDNNDGGIVVIIDEKNADNRKIGFTIGWDEIEYDNETSTPVERPAQRFVPFEEWIEKVGKPYFNDTYKDMFLAFCKQFGITLIEGTPYDKH